MAEADGPSQQRLAGIAAAASHRRVAAAAATKADHVASLPPLIPLETLFGNPAKTSAQISPDGKLLAYLAPSEDKDVLNVWVRSVDTDDARMVTNDQLRGIRSYQWAEDASAILYQQDIGGDENWHTWLQPLSSEPARDLTPFDGVRSQNLITDKHFPKQVLIGLNKRNPQLFDMYRIRLDGDGGEPELAAANPGDVLSWLTDAQFQIRGSAAMNPADGSTTLRTRDTVDSDWRDIITWPQEETGSPIAFTQDGQSLYVQSSLGSDTARLAKIAALDGSEQETLASNARADVGSVMISDIDRSVLAVSFNYLRREWTPLDPDIEADFKVLAGVEDGEFSVASMTVDERSWVVAFSRDNGPSSYYVYSRDTKESTFLFVTQPALADFTLSHMSGVVIPARDGLELPCYLSLPVLPDGQEAKNLPLVLNVHGGPWARDVWGYRPDVQWFTNRGYAVLQVIGCAFRGTYAAILGTGYGKGFLHAGDKEWGVGKMQHDLTDAVQWAIDQGIADPEKVAIYGGSYGGYATLAGLCFTPDLYCCGVDIVGPSHAKTLFQSIPPYWAPLKKQLIDRVGDVENDEEMNRKISPYFHADKITKPLVIGQGANDPRVKQAESDQIFKAAKGKGLDVQYFLYEDEGHGFARPSNRLDFYSRVEQFLKDHLGGRAQPLLTVSDSSIKVIESVA